MVTLFIVAASLLFGCSANKIPGTYGPGPTVATSVVTTSESPVVASVDAAGTTPKVFRGAWETEAFATLLRNGVRWGIEQRT